MLSKIWTLYHPVNLIKISLGEDPCSEKLARKVILKILKGEGKIKKNKIKQKKQVVLRNPAHQRSSWRIQPTSSAPHHHANTLLQSLICISDFPHYNKSSLWKGVGPVAHSLRVWPLWAGKSWQQKLRAAITLQPQSKVEGWTMRPIFFFFIHPYQGTPLFIPNRDHIHLHLLKVMSQPWKSLPIRCHMATE